MILHLDDHHVTLDIDTITEARDGLEDSGLTDNPDVARALLLLRRIVDDYHGTTWGARNTVTGNTIEAVGQEAAEYLVESLGYPWVLASKRDHRWTEVG